MVAERTFHCRNHGYFGLKCLFRLPGMGCPGPFLRYSHQCSYCHSEHYLYWSFWLWLMWNYAPYCGVAYRGCILEYLAHRQDAPGTSLATSEKFKAAQIFLVCFRRNVCV